MFISVLDAVFANLAMICLLIVVAKAVTKRAKWQTMDRYLMKIHRSVTRYLIVFGCVHGVLSCWQIWHVSMMSYVLGAFCLLAIIAAFISFQMRAEIGGDWKKWHRIASIIAVVLLILHIQ